MAYGLLVGCAMVFEEHLIFVPSRYPSGDWHPVGLQYDDVALMTQDGVRLHGWYCPVPRPRGARTSLHTESLCGLVFGCSPGSSTGRCPREQAQQSVPGARL